MQRILWRENYVEWVGDVFLREDYAKYQGFVSLDEMLLLMLSRDLSTVEKLIAYECWKEADGSCEGLIKLPSLPFESEPSV